MDALLIVVYGGWQMGPGGPVDPMGQPPPAPSPPQSIAGVPLATLPPGLRPRPIPFTFDEVAARLQTLPKIFWEPDGAFFWRCPNRTGTHLVEGELYDGGPTLHHVRLCLRFEPSAPATPKPEPKPAEAARSDISEPAVWPAPLGTILPALGGEAGCQLVELPAAGCYATLSAFLAWFEKIWPPQRPSTP